MPSPNNWVHGRVRSFSWNFAGCLPFSAQMAGAGSGLNLKLPRSGGSHELREPASLGRRLPDRRDRCRGVGIWRRCRHGNGRRANSLLGGARPIADLACLRLRATRPVLAPAPLSPPAATAGEDVLVRYVELPDEAARL